jgi:hypothetical protein
MPSDKTPEKQSAWGPAPQTPLGTRIPGRIGGAVRPPEPIAPAPPKPAPAGDEPNPVKAPRQAGRI